jgi:hypothetical protein
MFSSTILATLILLASSVLSQSTDSNLFLFPSSASPPYAYSVASDQSMKVTWTNSWTNLTLSLWNDAYVDNHGDQNYYQLFENRPYAAGQNEYTIDLSAWTLNFTLGTSFHLAMFQAGTSNQFGSGFFNITDAKAAAATTTSLASSSSSIASSTASSVTSSATTSAATTTTATSATSASTSSPSAGLTLPDGASSTGTPNSGLSDAAKVGLGVGIGLGIPLIALVVAGVILMRRAALRKVVTGKSEYGVDYDGHR